MKCSEIFEGLSELIMQEPPFFASGNIDSFLKLSNIQVENCRNRRKK